MNYAQELIDKLTGSDIQTVYINESGEWLFIARESFKEVSRDEVLGKTETKKKSKASQTEN